MGKRIDWTQAQKDEFLEHIACGDDMVTACSRMDITDRTVYRMLNRDPEFQVQYAKARERQQEAYMDKIIRMADEATSDDWQVVKLRIWTRQWVASKLAPKKYGERKVIAGDEEAPLTIQKIERVVVGD